MDPIPFNTLTADQKKEQMLYDAVVNSKFDKAENLINAGVSLSEAKNHLFGLTELSLFIVARTRGEYEGKWDIYQFLREHGYTLAQILQEDYQYLDQIEGIEAAEAKYLGTSKDSLLWQSAKRLSSEEREQIQHIPTLRKIVNAAHDFNRNNFQP